MCIMQHPLENALNNKREWGHAYAPYTISLEEGNYQEKNWEKSSIQYSLGTNGLNISCSYVIIKLGQNEYVQITKM